MDQIKRVNLPFSVTDCSKIVALKFEYMDFESYKNIRWKNEEFNNNIISKHKIWTK